MRPPAWSRSHPGRPGPRSAVARAPATRSGRPLPIAAEPVTRPVPRPWWERHRRRLAWDEQLLRQIQPEMALVSEPDGTPFVRGKIVIVSGVGFANRVPAEIRFPADYPR